MKGVYSVNATEYYDLTNVSYSKTCTVPCTDKSIGTTFLHVIAFVVPIQETRPVNSCKMSEHIKFKQNNGSDHLFYVIDSDVFIVYCVGCFRLLKSRGQFVQQMLPVRRCEQI